MEDARKRRRAGVRLLNGYESGSEEPWRSTSNRSFRVFGGDGQDSRLDIYIYGRHEAYEKKEDGSDEEEV